MKFSIRKPSPSMAVSVLALVVAGTGTSYAAGLIGSGDIRNDSIRSIDVKDGTLKPRDFRGNLPAGAQGPQGPIGPEGPAGVGRWALVDATGAIVAQSGGFVVEAAYPTLDPVAGGAPATAFRAQGNVYIDAQEDLSNNGILASIALQNAVDQNGDMIMNGRATGADANPEFSGEITVAMCGVAGVTACAPPGTNTNEYLVVSPRNSDGTIPPVEQRKRFYVVVTGDSSDFAEEPAA